MLHVFFWQIVDRMWHYLACSWSMLPVPLPFSGSLFQNDLCSFLLQHRVDYGSFFFYFIAAISHRCVLHLIHAVCADS